MAARAAFADLKNKQLNEKQVRTGIEGTHGIQGF
jgi:hypothetical protein